jgi:hypothetical protein
MAIDSEDLQHQANIVTGFVLFTLPDSLSYLLSLYVGWSYISYRKITKSLFKTSLALKIIIGNLYKMQDLRR